MGAVEPQKEINSVSSTEEEWNITVEIYNKPLKFKLDTGAKCNVLPIEKLDYTIQLKPTTTRLVGRSHGEVRSCRVNHYTNRVSFVASYGRQTK